MSNNEDFECQICGNKFNFDDVISAKDVNYSVIEFILKDTHRWEHKGYICIDDLNKYQGDYIRSMLSEKDESKISLDKLEVMHDIIKKEIASNDNVATDEHLTFGQRLADMVAKFGGSWKFIIIFGVILSAWMLLNIIFLSDKGFDPYPFILLNLVLSCIAALQAPIIMMSQNRQEEKDRERSSLHYQMDMKAEIEIRMLHDKIDSFILQQRSEIEEIKDMQEKIIDKLEDKNN